MLLVMVVAGGAVMVLLMMVVASSIVDDWLMVGWLGLDGGCVRFWICSRWKERG